MAVTRRKSIEKAALTVKSHTESIDILINNAGIYPREDSLEVQSISDLNMLKAFRVNVLGPLLCTQAFLPLLQRSRSAKIVMISSTAGSIALAESDRTIPYSVSKAALNMLTRLLSFRLDKDSIPILALYPGWVKTDMGGNEATLTISESVSGMANVIMGFSAKDPIYQDYSGEELPW
jgi:NAD(P)-dependent dehydrogenase (short-subunit alcohol dehydrogenase family)